MLFRRLKSTYVQGLFSKLKHEETLFERQKKFFDFCKNMSRLDKFYTDQEHEHFVQSQQLKRYALSGHEPIRDILSYYSRTRKDYSSQLILDTLEHLGGVIKSSKIMPYTDLDPLELQDSWQFQLVIHDLKLGLNEKDYLPPIYLARILIALSECKYKDTELVSQMISYMFKKSFDPTEPFANQVFKEHVYSGFQVSPEFSSHISTLIEWKDYKKPSAEDILLQIEKFTEMVHDLKLEQKDAASTIANINEQYYLLVSAQKSSPELEFNDDVTLGLNELQELLVEAGILNPYDMDNSDNFENLDKMMSRAERTFSNIVGKYFPHLNSRMVDSLYEASASHTEISLPPENLNVPNPNLVNTEVLGTYFIGLAKMMHLEIGDVNEGQEYPNIPWHRRARPLQNKYESTRVMYIDFPYTKMWLQSQKAVEDLVPHCRVEAAKSSRSSACKLLHGLGYCHIYDKETIDKLCDRIRKDNSQTDIETLAGGVFGLGMLNSHKETCKILLDELAKDPQVEDLRFSSLTRAMWGAIVLDLQNTPSFKVLVNSLMEFEPSDLSREDSQFFREVMLSLEYELKLPDYELPTQLAVSKAMSMNHWLDGRKLYNPVKPYLRKIGRYIMEQGLEKEEALKTHKKIKEAEKFPFFECDDIIGLNGFYTYLFFAGSEGVYKGNVLGTYAGRCKILKAIGRRGLPVPINEILEVDPYEPKVSTKSVESLSKYVDEFVGIPVNHLEKLDSFTVEFLDKMKEENEEASKKHESLLLLQDLVGAYKLQNTSRCKTGQYLHSQGLEEIKLQLFKSYHRYLTMSKTSQHWLNQLSNQVSKKSFPDLIKEVNQSITTLPLKKREFWQGSRQFMHLPSQESKKIDLTDEIINHKFLLLKDYFQYQDWAEDIQGSYPLATDMSLYEDDLFNNFYFIHRRQQIGMTPDPLASINSLKNFIPLETRFKVLLSNIKYELKRNFTDTEIINKILNLDVLDKLIENHLEPASYLPKYLKRNPEAFSEFVSCQMKATEDTDQYARFFREIYAKDAVKKEILHKMKKNLKAVASSEELDFNEKQYLKRDMITRYANTKEAVDIDDPERGLYFNPIFRQSFAVKTDPRYLRKFSFHAREEPDYLEFSSDLDYLLFKKRKAESTLIKTRIFHKLYNDIALSKNEEKYLAEYRKALASSSISQAGKVMVPGKPTSLKVSSLSQSDEAMFRSLHKVGSFISDQSIGEFSLNDLLFELSHFIDDYLVSRLEFNIIERKELENWGVFNNSTEVSKLKPLWNNKGLLWQNSALEEYIWRKSGHYTEKDVKDYLALFGYDKNKSIFDSIYWKMDTKSLNELLEDVKTSDFQVQFLREWWQRKVDEREIRVTIPDGKFAESDKTILQTWYKETVESQSKLFSKIFGYEYSEIKESSFPVLLKSIKKLLLEKDKETVQSVIRLVYFHPMIPDRAKEELYALSQNLNISLYVEGCVATDPIKVRGDKLAVEISEEEWVKRLENSSVNFLPGLINKVLG